MTCTARTMLLIQHAYPTKAARIRKHRFGQRTQQRTRRTTAPSAAIDCNRAQNRLPHLPQNGSLPLRCAPHLETPSSVRKQAWASKKRTWCRKSCPRQPQTNLLSVPQPAEWSLLKQVLSLALFTETQHETNQAEFINQQPRGNRTEKRERLNAPTISGL